MAAPWVLEQRTRDALAWAVDVLEDIHPAPDASDHLEHLRALNEEIGFDQGQAAGHGAAQAVAALCDAVEALQGRVEALERNT